MIKVKEVIIVEGRYDKNALLQVVDAVVIETAGFGIFNDEEKLALIRKLAECRGIVILTDSDGAGFVIRNYLKGAIDPQKVKHAYIPDIKGREKRKRSYSKERKLGVEGMRPEVLLDALRRSGATLDDASASKPELRISKADLYAVGLSGKADSVAKRQVLLKRLELPERLSSNALLDVLNALMSREAFLQFISSEIAPLYRLT